MLLNRRRFLSGIIAAPIVVRAEFLMPVKSIIMPVKSILIPTPFTVNALNGVLNVGDIISFGNEDITSFGNKIDNATRFVVTWATPTQYGIKKI